MEDRVMGRPPVRVLASRVPETAGDSVSRMGGPLLAVEPYVSRRSTHGTKTGLPVLLSATVIFAAAPTIRIEPWRDDEDNGGGDRASQRPKLLRIFRGALHPGCPGSGPKRRVFQFTVPAMKPAMSSSQPSSEICSAWRSGGRGCGTGCGAGWGGVRFRLNAARMLSRDGEPIRSASTTCNGSAAPALPAGPSSGLATGCAGGTAGAFSGAAGTLGTA